jgi:ribosomal protein S18 acetylase RimI-like enzyme
VFIRPATENDESVLHELWQDFHSDPPLPDWWDDSWDEGWAEIRRFMHDGFALVAEEDGAVVGYALARALRPRVVYLNDIYVRPDARRRGVAKALISEIVATSRKQGIEVMLLNVDNENAAARAVYRRLGFRERATGMMVELEQLEPRVARVETPPSFGSTHVQTDDEAGVQRALERFLPRLGRSEWSEVTPPKDGWVTVADELCDRDRSAQRRLGAELSDRMGVPVVAIALEEEAVVRFLLFERGRMVDEYLSVPTYYGPLNKADELSLAANPTLVARLTGAEPARVRAVARIAASPTELPPARELVAQIAAVMGLEARIER